MEPKAKRAASEAVYLAVDVGGTKIQASLITQAGVVLSRHRCPTPRDGGPEKVLEAIITASDETMLEESILLDQLTAVGIAIPGVVDPEQGLVVVTPNMSLTGISVGPRLEEHFGVPVALGNDCNLGALGESWLGSARGTGSSIAILVGTGVGSGIVQGGKLWTGARESAGEIGHIVMQIGGPKCGCGNLGCLEALASRTAIERDIRQGLAAGRTTILSELLGGDLSLIRSSSLRDALEAGDELVTEVLQKSVGGSGLRLPHGPALDRSGGDRSRGRRGGGVQRLHASDHPGDPGLGSANRRRDGGQVVLSALGDDAVVVGAAALAAIRAGFSPLEKQNAVCPTYPQIGETLFGEISVGKKTLGNDVVIRVDGKVKKRKKAAVKERLGTSHVVDVEELQRICRGGPEVVFIGSGHQGQMALNAESELYLSQRRIRLEVARTPDLAQAYNACSDRKVALIHVTC